MILDRFDSAESFLNPEFALQIWGRFKKTPWSQTIHHRLGVRFWGDIGSLLSEICWDILEDAQSFSIPAKTKGWNLQIVGFVLESRVPSQNLWYTLPDTNMKPPKIEMEVWFHVLFPFLPIRGPIFQVLFCSPVPLTPGRQHYQQALSKMSTWRGFVLHIFT